MLRDIARAAISWKWKRRVRRSEASEDFGSNGFAQQMTFCMRAFGGRLCERRFCLALSSRCVPLLFRFARHGELSLARHFVRLRAVPVRRSPDQLAVAPAIGLEFHPD